MSVANDVPDVEFIAAEVPTLQELYDGLRTPQHNELSCDLPDTSNHIKRADSPRNREGNSS